MISYSTEPGLSSVIASYKYYCRERLLIGSKLILRTPIGDYTFNVVHYGGSGPLGNLHIVLPTFNTNFSFK